MDSNKKNDELFGFSSNEQHQSDNEPSQNSDGRGEKYDSFSNDGMELPINGQPVFENKMSTKKRILMVATSILAAIVIFIAGIFSSSLFMPSDIKAFEWALDQVEKNYIGDIVEGKPAYTRQDFMKHGFSLLDKYSKFMTPEEYNAFDNSAKGEEQGLGVYINVKEYNSREYACVQDVDKGSSSHNKIFEGDLIVRINGSAVNIVNGGLSGYKLNGAGKNEVFDILRPVYDEQNDVIDYVEINGITLQNSAYTGDYVTYYDSKSNVEGNIIPSSAAYVKLYMFNEPADTEFAAAMNTMRSAGIKNLILDLRGNPGGFLTVAKYIGSFLIADGNSNKADFLIMEYKSGKKPAEDVKNIQYNGMNFDKIVVLVDEGSASASEVLLAAMIDYGTADLVIGSNTYGKGIAQSTIVHSTGYALTITASRWFSPKGISYHKTGILPSAGYETEKNPKNYPYMLRNDTAIAKAVHYINS